MTDMVKGILIGAIAIKIIESDTVQNYIHKVIRKKCHDFGEKVADAIFPVDEESKNERYKEREKKRFSGRYEWTESDKEIEKILYDEDGKPYKVIFSQKCKGEI